LALNWDIDMSLYQYLHPCGFSGDVMTRVADWTDVTTTEILQKTALLTFLAHHLQLEEVHSASFSAQKTAQIPEFLAKFGLDE
jgi:lipoate-protein ligase B